MRQTLVHDLRELIAALDHRVPRAEREGTRALPRDAQGLKRAALKRIDERVDYGVPQGAPAVGQETT